MFGKQKLPSLLQLSSLSVVTAEQLATANAELTAQNITGVKLVPIDAELSGDENPFSDLQEKESAENLTASNLALKELGITSQLMSAEDLALFSQYKTSLSGSGFDTVEKLLAAQQEAQAKVDAFPADPPSTPESKGEHDLNGGEDDVWNSSEMSFNKDVD